MTKLRLLFDTVRFLRPVQVYWRFVLRIKHFFPFPEHIKEVVRIRHIILIPPVCKHTSLLNGQFKFLNVTYRSGGTIDWNIESMSKLWLYNLHYFDYLNQQHIDDELTFDLIRDWIERNPVGSGNGWEPYTLSLRIVNWIKFLVDSGVDHDRLMPVYESLFIQSRYLARHLEYHLLGNHLYKNGVALLFAGALFEGKEVQGWLEKGRGIIMQQTREQVLADGGHFERSPMYHVLILEDMLDCLNLEQARACFTSSEVVLLQEKAAGMLGFLADIVHQDGEIPFFNDSALHIAPSPNSVFNYAETLGIKFSRDSCHFGVVEKTEFGLLILQNNLSKVIFDVGAIGPDYLPGHAHCDTLSYELSLGGHRCIVNSGTYQYAGEERNSFRSTAAHNTVQVDGVEQHEIWSTFRVARRGYPMDIQVKQKAEDRVECTATVSGFKGVTASPLHKRSLRLDKYQLTIVDTIQGDGEHTAVSYIHLHPQVEIIQTSPDRLVCTRGGREFTILTQNSISIDIQKGWFSAEFGLKVENTVLVLRKQACAPFSFAYQVCF